MQLEKVLYRDRLRFTTKISKFQYFRFRLMSKSMSKTDHVYNDVYNFPGKIENLDPEKFKNIEITRNNNKGHPCLVIRSVASIRGTSYFP